MNKYEEKYKKIVKKLVEKNFPTLRDEKIIIEENEMKSNARAKYGFTGFKIIVSFKLRKFPSKILKGLFAHELCHFEIFKKRGVIITKLGLLLYFTNSKFREKEEKKADKLTIKKGYGKELIYTRKYLKLRKPEFYLTDNEIKHFIKKYKK